MIVDTMINVAFSILFKLLDKLPFMKVEIDLTVMNTFLDIIGTCLYLFPWQKVAPILAIIVVMQVYRIVVSIIRVIWELLPIA